MNIQEIKEKVLGLTSEDNHIRLPFSLMESAIESTKRESNMDVHQMDFSTIHFFRVVNAIKAVLEYLNIEFEYPLLENGDIDAYATYDQFIELYEILEYNTLFRYNELLDAEIELAIKERVSIGQFESKIISIAEKLTESVSKISDVATDKKKLKPLLNEINKAFKGLDIGKLNGIKEVVEK